MNNPYQNQNQRAGMMSQAMQRRPAGPMAPGGMGMRRNPIQGAAMRRAPMGAAPSQAIQSYGQAAPSQAIQPYGQGGLNQSQQARFNASRAAAQTRSDFQRRPIQAPAGGVDMMGGTTQPQAAYGQGYSIGPAPQPYRPPPQMNMQLDPMALQQMQMAALGGY